MNRDLALMTSPGAEYLGEPQLSHQHQQNAFPCPHPSLHPTETYLTTSIFLRLACNKSRGCASARLRTDTHSLPCKLNAPRSLCKQIGIDQPNLGPPSSTQRYLSPAPPRITRSCRLDCSRIRQQWRRDPTPSTDGWSSGCRSARTDEGADSGE